MKKVYYFIILLLFVSLVSCSETTYQVKFIGFDDMILKAEVVNENANLEYPNAPAVDGYTFVEWDQDIEKVTSDLVIKAIYRKNQFRVVFYNELDEIISEQIVDYGKSAENVTLPSKEGYNFIGWDKEFSNVTDDLYIKPVFDQKELTVKFYDEAGSIIKTEMVKYGESAIGITLQDKVGYKFVGWDKSITNITSDLEVYPVYEVMTFIVKFYDENNNVLKTETVNYGENASYNKIPEKTGYKFIGWDKELTNVLSDLDVYPVYEIMTYMVNFYDFDKNVVKTETVEFGKSAIGATLKELDGYNFIGWDKEFTNVISDLDVYPVYEVITFTVKFYDFDKNLIKIETVNYGSNAVGVYNLTKEGYEFIGWDKNLTNVLSDLDVYPIFEQITYVVNFYDIEGNIIKTEEVPHGESAEGITAPSVYGYKFVRWDENIEEVTNDLDVFPIYEEEVYTVTFVDFYGNILKTENVKYKESATAPNAPVVEYHTFSKWSLDFSEVKNNMTIKAVYNSNFNSYQISNVNYWLQILSKKYDINQTILTQTEISSYNAKITSNYTKTKVVDVLSITGSKTSSYVSELINKYSNINKYTVYDKDTNQTISSTVKENILSNRNLNNIPSSVTVKYGIITDFAWMRSYPTNHYSQTYDMDRFQETSLNVGEGVAIYHESADKEWYFVQAENYNGWVEKKYIAECNYDELESFLKPSKNLVVISDYVTLQSAHVRMGQSFPLLNVNSDSYVISFPTRTTDGKLSLIELAVAKSNDYHEGYLEYTYKNVFIQAFKLLGIDYSWGDKSPLGRDCSSTMNAIYKSFGFMMPRNTSNQVAIPTYGSSVGGFSNTSIQTYKPGTMIFTSSHVMLYIGEDLNGTAYLLHNTTSGDGACILQSLNSYGGSKINGVLKLQ